MTTRKRISVLAALTIATAGLLAPTAHAAATRYITITSQGSVKVVPDAVRINATASVVAATSKDALAATAKSSAAVRTALTAAKVDKKDIATQNVSVYPEYKYAADGTSSIIGYRASQVFTIVIRSAATAGEVVDSIVLAGGDNLQVNGVTPFILDSTSSTTAARSVAVKSARAKATSYASLLGVKLGKVNYLIENSAPTNFPPVMALAKSESDATVIDLGQQDVTVSVTVQWSLL